MILERTIALNKRQNSLLLEITDPAYSLGPTVQSLAKLHNVSEQTIKSDISVINYILSSNNQSLIRVADDGYVLSPQSLDLSFCDAADFYSYKLSPVERKTVLAMILLTIGRYTTIAELADKVMVSRNTLISDLDDLRSWFSENSLSFVSQPRKGLIVIGSEHLIRKGMLKLLLLNDLMYENDGKIDSNIFQMLLLQQLGAADYIKEIKTALKKAENDQDVYLSDFSFRKMCYFMLILIDRVGKGKYLSDMSDEEWSGVRCSSKYGMAEVAYTELTGLNDFHSHCAELASIIEQLRGESYIKNNKPNQDTEKMAFQILINEFIYKLSKVYDIHYYLNFYLYDLLISHIEAAAYRMQRKHILTCPITDQLESEYSDKFRDVERLLKPLEDYISAKASRDEIAFIVIYLLAILENNNTANVSVNTLLVCSTGRGSAQLIMAKLSSSFESIVIQNVISSHSINDMPLQEIDLILTTIPLDEIDLPVVHISPLISEDDESRIQRAMIQIQRRKRLQGTKPAIPVAAPEHTEQELGEQKGKRLCELLEADMIALDVHANDWRDAVALAGGLLSEKGIAEERYTQGMIRNIEVNGPYVVIYPGIAIPHAEHSDGSLKEGACLVRLARPVMFNHEENDPVSFVIAFSLLDSTSIGRALYNLTKMLATDSFIRSLKDAKDVTELINSVNQYESRVDAAWR